jgi:hypothetical protein
VKGLNLNIIKATNESPHLTLLFKGGKLKASLRLEESKDAHSYLFYSTEYRKS